ncbi:hypothetical protein DPMN_029158 [Dreissena polymorpha]|uniref:Uncharacterized protein n=1 Tax=Dreissena polymorpha TaxID=45954 RepID=A0A9D4LVZ0_DREPO|nr:hypothetical protein DPMN_029158 [Dreissena polymorpha]
MYTKPRFLPVLHSQIYKASQHELQKHLHMDFQMRGASPSKGDNYYRDVDSSDENQHDLSPLGEVYHCNMLRRIMGWKELWEGSLPRSTVTDVSLATGILQIEFLF